MRFAIRAWLAEGASEPELKLTHNPHHVLGQSSLHSGGRLVTHAGQDVAVADPIEEAFAKIKNLLRNAAARSKEALLEAIAAALSAVTAEDARSFFEHAGYRPIGQLL